MTEKTVEKALVKRIKGLGGWAVKCAIPGTSGMPDRLILFPGGRVAFVECKRPGEKVSKIQEYRIQQLRTLGFTVWVVDRLEEIERFIEEVMPK